jgi:hypothetical protein
MNTMNISYMLYQAERPRSAAEQRAADAQVGELAAAVARLGRSLRHAITGTKDHPGREGSAPGYGDRLMHGRAPSVSRRAEMTSDLLRRAACPRDHDLSVVPHLRTLL